MPPPPTGGHLAKVSKSSSAGESYNQNAVEAAELPGSYET